MIILKQCVGIDISKSTFSACLCNRPQKEALIYSKVHHFKNEKTGFNQLLRWVRKQRIAEVELVFLMEATGVYYEQLAYFLKGIKQEVHVVLPNTSKHYFSSLNVKTKTDELDAKVLSRFGVERNHKSWQAPKESYLELRNLTRYYVQLQEQKTALGNIKHSKMHANQMQKMIIRSNTRLIKEIDKQILLVKREIEKLIKNDAELRQKVENLQTIPGVGILTIATIIAETLGFEYVQNVKQLTSYAGYDVVHRESGTSIKGKTRISKKGNRYIRKALYFPAMVACRFNPILKQTYIRIIRKKSSKMVGQVAIQRKLLILIYSLWRKNEEFNPIFNQRKIASEIPSEAIQDSTTQVALL